MAHNKPILGRQINWSHPLAKGLVGCWLANEGSGPLYDITQYQRDYIMTLYAGANWTSGKYGHAINYASSSSQYAQVDKCPLTAWGFTIACWFLSVDITNQQVFFWVGDSALTADHCYLNLKNGTDVIATYAPGGTAANATATKSYSANTWHLAVAAFDDAWCKVWLDGGNSAVASGITKPWMIPDRTGLGRACDASPGYHLDGKIGVAYIWNHVLTDLQVAQLYREPFCMFKKDPIELWATVTVATVVPQLQMLRQLWAA